MRRNAWKEIANWHMKKMSHGFKSLLHGRTTITSKKEELETVGDSSKVCSQSVLKCFFLELIGRPDVL